MVDGDTITLDGTRWRLWGIDAPETQQRCADGWPARLETIRRLIERREVVCELRGRDRPIYRAMPGRDPGSRRRHLSAGMARRAAKAWPLLYRA
jgi:hypothetical protein